MATLVLTKRWVNLYPTGEVLVSAQTADDGGPDVRSANARTAVYAGGRQRTISTKGVSGSWTFTLVGVTTADTERLIEHLAQTVLVRDNRGRKMYGSLFSVPRTPWKDQLDLYDVEVTVNLVDVDEAV